MDYTRDSINGYQLCNDSVTVYHEEGGAIERSYFERAYIDFKKTENVDRTGSSEANGFLLVIPGDVSLHVGDKVLVGEGPQVPEDAVRWWRTFVPAKVDGLVVVRTVDPKRFGGRVVHVEAGG